MKRNEKETNNNNHRKIHWNLLAVCTVYAILQNGTKEEKEKIWRSYGIYSLPQFACRDVRILDLVAKISINKFQWCCENKQIFGHSIKWIRFCSGDSTAVRLPDVQNEWLFSVISLHDNHYHHYALEWFISLSMFWYTRTYAHNKCHKQVIWYDSCPSVSTSKNLSSAFILARLCWWTLCVGSVISTKFNWIV